MIYTTEYSDLSLKLYFQHICVFDCDKNYIMEDTFVKKKKSKYLNLRQYFALCTMM